MSFISVKEYAEKKGIRVAEVYRFVREHRFDPEDVIRETKEVKVIKINENAELKK
jgi:hypothetical protein